MIFQVYMGKDLHAVKCMFKLLYLYSNTSLVWKPALHWSFPLNSNIIWIFFLFAYKFGETIIPLSSSQIYLGNDLIRKSLSVCNLSCFFYFLLTRCPDYRSYTVVYYASFTYILCIYLYTFNSRKILKSLMQNIFLYISMYNTVYIMCSIDIGTNE